VGSHVDFHAAIHNEVQWGEVPDVANVPPAGPGQAPAAIPSAPKACLQFKKASVHWNGAKSLAMKPCANSREGRTRRGPVLEQLQIVHEQMLDDRCAMPPPQSQNLIEYSALPDAQVTLLGLTFGQQPVQFLDCDHDQPPAQTILISHNFSSLFVCI
jgi:hypothetical protein